MKNLVSEDNETIILSGCNRGYDVMACNKRIYKKNYVIAKMDMR